MQTALFVLTFASMFVGGIFQSLTGFGAGIIILPALSFFLPILSVSAISSICSLCISAVMAWRFRRYIQWKKLLLPYPVFIAASYAAFVAGPLMDPALLGTICGCFFIFIGLWTMWSGKRGIKLSPSPFVAIPVVALCGVLSGWFSMSGPLLGLYFLAATREVKYHYISTIQMFITMTCIGNTFSRISTGILTADLIPFIAAGTAGVLLGQFFGVRVLYRINVEAMKKIILGGLVAIGIMQVVKYTCF